MTEHRRYDDCGLDGDDNAPVHAGTLNKLLRRIAVNHLLPLSVASELMQAHIQECAKLQAYIAGGIKVLKVMMGICIAVGTAILITWATKALWPH